jgi:uncharacterized protein YggE
LIEIIHHLLLIINLILNMLNTKFLTNLALSVAIIIAGLYLVKFLDISYPVNLTSTNRSTELSVVGEGKVDVTPDTAYIDVGITVNNGASVDAVQKQMSQTNNAIIDAMKKLGIAKADIKTSNYSIYPNYVYDGRNNQLDGYNGNAQVEIRARSPQMASQVIEAATAAGANQVNGTRFVVDKPEKYREEARNKAVANAREQAQKIASNLGIRLGRVVNIVESSAGSPIYPMPMYGAAEKSIGLGGGGGANIEPGSQTITSVVTLYFEKR